MASRFSLMAPTRCSGCQRSVLRSFTSSAGVLIGLPKPSYQVQQTPIIHLQRPFSSPTSKLYPRKLQSWRKNVQEPAPEFDVHGDNEVILPEPSKELLSSVPWYLQTAKLEKPLDLSSPAGERQRIPDLPPYPPPLLPEFLEHISVDLGLDDLTIFDLRELDPPPAIGANSIMVIGTARSEKHLHVSADRFCRWLRSSHKLRPHAAGLLGRNELKLKLRRKARRSKLMANVGADETASNLDDGIRTGWICVTVGSLKPNLDAPKPKAKHDFIGFGERLDEVNLVIQMFTEEKRTDMDLEGLWERVLRRHEKAQNEDLIVQQDSQGGIKSIV
jgi:ribosomal silencing factor RsfS